MPVVFMCDPRTHLPLPNSDAKVFKKTAVFKVGGGSFRGEVIGYVFLFLFFYLIRKSLFSLYSLEVKKDAQES